MTNISGLLQARPISPETMLLAVWTTLTSTEKEQAFYELVNKAFYAKLITGDQADALNFVYAHVTGDTDYLLGTPDCYSVGGRIDRATVQEVLDAWRRMGIGWLGDLYGPLMLDRVDREFKQSVWCTDYPGVL